jgi:hypothetical protein
MILLGLTGFAKSGKSTTANLLKAAGYEEVSFANKLKDVCSHVFGVPRDYFDDQDKKERPLFLTRILMTRHIEKIFKAYDIDLVKLVHCDRHLGKELSTPRQIAQYVGTNLLRRMDEDIHVKSLIKTLKPTGKYVISDVRFYNEADSIRNAGGSIIGISRQAATPADETTLHESETYIPSLLAGSNFLIINDDSKFTLESRLKTILSQIESGVRNELAN